jgi:hypothetical protein
MLQEKIEETVNSYNEAVPDEPLFHYSYGKDHWQNLCDHAKDGLLPFEERSKYFKLLYVDEDDTLNEYSAVVGTTYTGEIIILASSMISDTNYEYKFETHIKHCKALADKFRDDLAGCDGWHVRKWSKTEVENIYDNNLDGIKVRFVMYRSDGY